MTQSLKTQEGKTVTHSIMHCTIELLNQDFGWLQIRLKHPALNPEMYAKLFQIFQGETLFEFNFQNHACDSLDHMHLLTLDGLSWYSAISRLKHGMNSAQSVKLEVLDVYRFLLTFSTGLDVYQQVLQLNESLHKFFEYIGTPTTVIWHTDNLDVKSDQGWLEVNSKLITFATIPDNLYNETL